MAFAAPDYKAKCGGREPLLDIVLDSIDEP